MNYVWIDLWLCWMVMLIGLFGGDSQYFSQANEFVTIRIAVYMSKYSYSYARYLNEYPGRLDCYFEHKSAKSSWAHAQPSLWISVRDFLVRSRNLSLRCMDYKESFNYSPLKVEENYPNKLHDNPALLRGKEGMMTRYRYQSWIGIAFR